MIYADKQTREDEPTTTQNILDSLKTGIEETFSEQNIKKAVDNVNEFGGKIKEIGSKIFTNVQNVFSANPENEKS